jgi:hypothetical protein
MQWPSNTTNASGMESDGLLLISGMKILILWDMLVLWDIWALTAWVAGEFFALKPVY